MDWLDGITRLFPKETVERLQRDAIERYEIHDIVTDPAVLERVEPNPALLRAVLRTKHLMNPEVLRLARRIVEAVVRDLTARLATEVRQAFSGVPGPPAEHPAAGAQLRRPAHDPGEPGPLPAGRATVADRDAAFLLPQPASTWCNGR